MQWWTLDRNLSSLLQEIARSCKEAGQPLPQLELPTARLFGKDGSGGGRELVITAQLTTTIAADGESVSVPVFIQPNSKQRCLLGMNALPALGFTMLRANGEPLITKSEKNPTVSMVRLVQGTTIPSLKGSFVKVEMELQGKLPLGAPILFEPLHSQLESAGLHSHESLVEVCEDGSVLVPLMNVGGTSASLERGMEVGVIQQVKEFDKRGGDNKGVSEPVLCAQVETLSLSSERVEQVLQALGAPSSKLSKSQKQQLTRVIRNYADVFALNDSELGCTNLVQHSIDTGDNKPVKQHPYRTPMVHREIISQMIDEMHEQGIIQPSMSPWASPVILVPKKDDSIRFCVDYRRLNAVTKRDVYPLPRIDDILDTLGKAKYFSSLDLASGYWQVELDEDARQKSAFTTHRGLFEFLRMPFGLCNAPATFQRLMQVVLVGLDGTHCFVYLDDILIASQTFEEHLKKLCEVFERLRKAGLRLKPKKCLLLREEVLYLGHVVSAAGIKPDPAKIEKVLSYPVPTDVTKVRQFLGLASYYRRFISGFARISHSLHALTRKDVAFVWSDDCNTAFNLLKECLVRAPVLSYPQFGEGEEFVLETDASGVGLGAVLAQKQEDDQLHPIAYASRSLDQHERNYGITELETLALVWAVRYFRPYILGHRTTVYTDHAACMSLLNTARPSGKLARWALTIQEMDLVIKHRSGKSNTNADALSRIPTSSVGAIETLVVTDSEECLPLPGGGEMEKLKISQKQDPDLVPMCQYLGSDVLPTDEKVARKIVTESQHFELIQGVLYFEPAASAGRLCVVVPKGLRDALLKESHASCFAGHFSAKKVYDRLRRHYWWKGMRADVHHFCRKCLVCASRKGPGKPIRPPLEPIPVLSTELGSMYCSYQSPTMGIAM